jgi:hypothetical protein
MIEDIGDQVGVAGIVEIGAGIARQRFRVVERGAQAGQDLVTGFAARGFERPERA